jgi:hypothetical protein
MAIDMMLLLESGDLSCTQALQNPGGAPALFVLAHKCMGNFQPQTSILLFGKLKSLIGVAAK